MATNMSDKDAYCIRIYHGGTYSEEEVLAYSVADAIKVANKSRLLEQFTSAPEIVSVTRITNGNLYQ